MAKKAGKIALGLGLITGAVTGLLFAPEEGKKIRKKIASGDTDGLLKDVAKMGGEIADLADEIMQRPGVQDALHTAKGKIADAADMHRDDLDQMLADANKKAEAFKKQVAKYVKEQKAQLDKQVGKKKKKKPSKKKSTAKKKVAKKAPAKKKAAPKKTTAKKPAAKKAAPKKKTTPKKKKS